MIYDVVYAPNDHNSQKAMVSYLFIESTAVVGHTIPNGARNIDTEKNAV